MKLKASVLPTVIVLGVLMLTTVWMLVGLIDLDVSLFATQNRLRIERINVESAFRLYCNYPQTDGRVELFARDTLSEVSIHKRSWGLYDLISIRSHAGRTTSSRLVGRNDILENGATFWYRDNLSTLILAGNTNLKGGLFLPVNGVVYTTSGGLAFCGEEILTSCVASSQVEIPAPEQAYVNRIDSLFNLHKLATLNNSIECTMENSFMTKNGWMVSTNYEILRDHTLKGDIMLLADEITLDSSCTISNIVIVARKATIGKSFKGSMQLFVTDSIVVDSASVLHYPSGLYAQKYIQIKEKTRVEGYVIVRTDPSSRDGLNYCQARSARLRGLLYVDGLAQLQGVVSGSAVLNRVRHYTQEGFYNDMMCDATVIQDRDVSYPLWLRGPDKRKEVCRVE